MVYLFGSDLLSLKQHRFLQILSWPACRFVFLNLLSSLAYRGMAFAVTQLNMSKAFDCVFQLHLISVVRSVDTIDHLLSWLASYLTLGSKVASTGSINCNPDLLPMDLYRVAYCFHCNALCASAKHLVQYLTLSFLFADNLKLVLPPMPNNVNTAVR